MSEKTFEIYPEIKSEKVYFNNRFGIKIAGDLYLPADYENQKKPAIAVSGPFGGVKEQCSGLYALTVVGARWKLPIVWYLTEEDGLHYNELRRRVQGITDTALARNLHELEDDGSIMRHDAKSMPMSVTYHLTDVGKKLMPALKELYSWGEEHRATVEDGGRG